MLTEKKKINLVLYDMEQFIKKYTRFLTKNTYISKNTYERFLNQYHYLYQTLETESFLYQNHPYYHKLNKIKEESLSLLKLHNLKYLKRKRGEYQDFFQEIDANHQLDNIKKNIILLEEEKLVYFHQKNNIPFLLAKIKYLTTILKYDPPKILILVKDQDDYLSLNIALSEQGLDSVPCLLLHTYRLNFLTKGEKLLTKKREYEFLKNYLINILYPNKKEFHAFVKAFSNYLYFNKDYQDFDTFKDYHHYLYKRIFEKSNLSLKKFNEQEMKKRKKQQRTIQNEDTATKASTNIANFLYLNSIDYSYQKEEDTFYLETSHPLKIKFQKGTFLDLTTPSQDSSQTIILYEHYQSQKKYLEVLTYELIKRRIPMEKREEEHIFQKLEDTSIDGYFLEVIEKVLIKAIHHQETFHTLKNTKLTAKQIQVLNPIIEAYQIYLEEQHFISKEILDQRIEEKINQDTKDYTILWNIKNIHPQNHSLLLVSEPEDNILLKENLKRLQDYHQFLNQEKYLPFSQTFISLTEKEELTKRFLKHHLLEINQNVAHKQKPIYITYYEDHTRMESQKSRKNTLDQILTQYDAKDIFIASPKKEYPDIAQDSLLKLNTTYPIIILPNLIKDQFHEDLFQQTEILNKLKLYSAITKCQKEIWILCPSSQRKESQKLFSIYPKVNII